MLLLVLQTPPFERALPGITMLRLLDLLPEVSDVAAGSAGRYGAFACWAAVAFPPSVPIAEARRELHAARGLAAPQL
jgi:hypothetical protein